ncbi:chemotaxis protein CheA [Alteromonas sp. ASW11-36]|uniref:Chemotaxis protein CheA n=1 Tax=Alteromonas arenosi TaxID=3055817 RepID=A0ABT7T1U1_9ALTE|nr:chemotaxis protein CheA [Alteromonas sp. ASW11-36]MDM7862189.1 chemotaxis protein CheA [Alteromonas sp. ASW11-36]
MSVDMSQFHSVFFEESQEHLRDMESLLLGLNIEDPDPEHLNGIFRAAHSIKGGSGIFGFDALTGLTHVMENMLDKARSKALHLDKTTVDLLLSTTDHLTEILNAYQTGSDIDWGAIELGIGKLEAANPGAQTIGEDDQGFGFFEPLESVLAADEEDSFGFFEPLEDAEKATTTTIEVPPEGIDTTPLPKIKAAAKVQPLPPAEASTIRVDTNKIDGLVNLVGELVITQSILRLANQQAHGALAETLENAINELARNTRDIQDSVLSMRMLPISFVFNRFPRVIRDLSTKLNKHIDLEIQGGDTEIDKGMIEKLVDPLTHLVRNSVDHGIESPDARITAKKPERGLIRLCAEQRSGNVYIHIEDDGKGMDREKIISKAIKAGLIEDDNLVDSDVWKLIFAPGFSTADAVTDVSGRGVGMDVVKRNIEDIKGTIDIQSTPGQGSKTTIRLPLTLAILDSMCVTVGDQTFVIPLLNIVETMQPSADQIKTIGNDRLLSIRGDYWPIVDLHSELGLQNMVPAPEAAILVLIESSQRRFALLVDALAGQQQVVIKSLEQHYRRIEQFAGATIMGDGSVAMILDIETLATKAANVESPEEVDD